ncbi:MAG: hypothetical protein AAB807_00145, partial [Patescibacteria group bacterium]
LLRIESTAKALPFSYYFQFIFYLNFRQEAPLPGIVENYLLNPTLLLYYIIIINRITYMGSLKTSFIVVVAAALIVGLGGGYYYGFSKGGKTVGPNF